MPYPAIFYPRAVSHYIVNGDDGMLLLVVVLASGYFLPWKRSSVRSRSSCPLHFLEVLRDLVQDTFAHLRRFDSHALWCRRWRVAQASTSFLLWMENGAPIEASLQTWRSSHPPIRTRTLRGQCNGRLKRRQTAESGRSGCCGSVTLSPEVEIF